MDIDVLDRLVRNEAIGLLSEIGFQPDDIRDDHSLVTNMLPQIIQGHFTREAAILNNARANIRNALSPRYRNEWEKQARWAEQRLSDLHDLGERYPIKDEDNAG